MNIRPSNTYRLKLTLAHASGDEFDISIINKVIFRFGKLDKTWAKANHAEVDYIDEGVFELSLSQEETASFRFPLEVQAMIFFKDGMVRQTNIEAIASLPTLFARLKAGCCDGR